MNANEVIGAFDAFCEAQGIGKFEFEGDSAVRQIGEDGAVLTVRLDAEAGSVTFVASLGELPSDFLPVAFRTMLSANFGWQAAGAATFAWCEPISQPVLQLRVPGDGLDAESIGRVLQPFLSAVEEWRKALAEAADGYGEEENGEFGGVATAEELGTATAEAPTAGEFVIRG